MLPLTTITATLFSATIVVTYLSVRLRWANIPSALVVGFMVNALGFFLFALARDNGLNQALLVAFVQGTIFTVASVTMGAFFRGPAHKLSLREEYALEFAAERVSATVNA
jgi:xanthine/uracil/vitamin C permease (AzgA family)